MPALCGQDTLISPGHGQSSSNLHRRSAIGEGEDADSVQD